MNELQPPNFTDPIERNARILESFSIRLQDGLIGLEGHAGALTDGIFANQHVLLEGIPGTGKTEMIKNIERMIKRDDELVSEDDPEFVETLKRFQGNRDSLPSDVLGTRVYNMATGQYEVEKGPVFAHFLQADELNRNDTRTQAGLNQALEEREVSIGGKTYKLPEPGITLATQNSYAFGQATQRMDDSLVDRFGTSIVFEKPTESQRTDVQTAYAKGHDTPNQQGRIFTIPGIKEVMDSVRNQPVEESAVKRVTEVIEGVIGVDGLKLVSEGHRPGRSAVRLAQAHAMRHGKAAVTKKSVDAVMPHVLTHRIATVHGAEKDLDDRRQIVQDVIEKGRG